MIILPSVIMTMSSDEDRDFMEWLYREHHKLMFTAAWRVSQDNSIIDDIVSESCLKLIEKISILRTMRDCQLRAYIVSTVRNTALNLLSRQNRRESHIKEDAGDEIDELADEFDVEKKILLDEELDRVWSAIKQLPIKEQQIMRMKYAMGMSDEEIADAAGLAVSSVRKYISRAREKIRAIVYHSVKGA